MHIIGITGGVGAGKSEVLSFLSSAVSSRVVFADEVAKKLTSPGGECFEAVKTLFGEEVLTPRGEPDRRKMAALFFRDRRLRERFDALVHPAVKRELLRDMTRTEKEGLVRFYFLEAALLIEEGYGEICEELWFIYAPEETRRQRLKESRGYSDEKVTQIFQSQLPEEEFFRHTQAVIDNSGAWEETVRQLEKELHRLT